MPDRESQWDDWLELLFLLVMIAALAIGNRLGRLIRLGLGIAHNNQES